MSDDGLDANMDGDGNMDGNMGDEKKDDEPKGPFNPLKPDLLKKSLSKLSKTYNGLSYAYACFTLVEKEIDEIGEEIGNYVHLRDINISNNKIPSIKPFENFTYLLRLNANTNEIKDLDIFSFKDKLQFLQTLNLSNNKIRELTEMNLSSLTDLNLDTNKITSAKSFTGLPNLLTLKLRTNALKTCEGLANMPKLHTLHLTENQITTMKGLENLPNLKKLVIKKNQLEKLNDIPDLPELEILLMKENKVQEETEISKLRFPKMKNLNIAENEVCTKFKAGAKVELILLLEDFEFKKLNKEEVTKEDFEEAKKVKEERIKEAEEKRKEEEAEAERKKQEDELNRQNELANAANNDGGNQDNANQDNQD